MKQMKVIGLAVLLLAGSALAGSGLILDEKDGLTEKVEVRSYDSKAQAVKVITSNGVVSRPFSTFNAASQKKIMDWHEDQTFQSSARLRIKIDDIEKDGSPEDTKEISYKIILTNRSDIELTGIKIDSRIFYEYQINQEDSDRAKQYKVNHFEVDIPAGEERVFQTKPLEIRSFEKRVEVHNTGEEKGYVTKSVEDKLLGIDFSFTKIGFDGKTISRKAKDGRVPSSKKIADFELKK